MSVRAVVEYLGLGAAITVVIAALLFLAQSDSTFDMRTLLGTVGPTALVTFCALLAGTVTYDRVRARGGRHAATLSAIGSLGAALLMAGIINLVATARSDREKTGARGRTFLFTGLVTLVCAGMLVRLQQLKERTRAPNAGAPTAGGRPSAEETAGDAPRTKQEAIALREGSRIHRLPIESILYLRAHGNRTIVHCTDRDYETASRLGDLERRLTQQEFTRIHKSYVVRLSHLSHIEYDIGGAYVAYLRDEDETSLPVGRTYARALRGRLGLP